jgi:type I restriction enzyme R subunit
VHIATVQGMVQRVLYSAEDKLPPPIDQYDCIVVDECHRGYLLDRELSDTELSFRGYDDYISKYRRVLDYFDAVKIGLTATPALHTTQIFGAPVFTYSYREAVVDGYLVDYEPPIQITPNSLRRGISWKAGEEVKVYNTGRQQIELFKAPDEIKLKVDDFNRKVITDRSMRWSATTWRRSSTRPPPQDPDLLRQRQPRRPGGGPAEEGLRGQYGASRTTPSSRSPARPTSPCN